MRKYLVLVALAAFALATASTWAWLTRNGHEAITTETPPPSSAPVVQILRVEDIFESELEESDSEVETPSSSQPVTEKLEHPTQLALAAKLVFISQGDPACIVKAFDLASGSVTELGRPVQCPTRVSIVDDKATVLLVAPDSIQELRLGAQTSMAAPVLLPAVPVEPRWSLTAPIEAGYWDGNLFVVFRSYHDLTDMKDRLYVRDSNVGWQLRHTNICDSRDTEDMRSMEDCVWQEIIRRPERADFWGDEAQIWHKKQRDNPYATSVTEWAKTTQYEGRHEAYVTTTEFVLEFDGRRSTLSYEIWDGLGDSSKLGDVKLKIEDDVWQVLHPGVSHGVASALLMGKFLLVQYEENGPKELFDLETGGRKIGVMAFGEWMYPPP